LTVFPIVLFFTICRMSFDKVSYFNVAFVLLAYGLLCAFLVLYVVLLPKHRKELFAKIVGQH
jgi:hypothetical protein